MGKVSPGIALLVISAVVVGGGLAARHVFGEKGGSSSPINNQIKQSVKVNNLGSPFAFEFEVTYENKTDQLVDFEGIMQARHCEGAALGLINEPIVLEPREITTRIFTFEFNPADLVGCPNVKVDFFAWRSLAIPTAFGQRKTVTVNL